MLSLLFLFSAIANAAFQIRAKDKYKDTYIELNVSDRHNPDLPFVVQNLDVNPDINMQLYGQLRSANTYKDVVEHFKEEFNFYSTFENTHLDPLPSNCGILMRKAGSKFNTIPHLDPRIHAKVGVWKAQQNFGFLQVDLSIQLSQVPALVIHQKKFYVLAWAQQPALFVYAGQNDENVLIFCSNEWEKMPKNEIISLLQGNEQTENVTNEITKKYSFTEFRNLSKIDAFYLKFFLQSSKTFWKNKFKC